MFNMLFVNADDWGRTSQTTKRILTCYRQGRIHTASAMTFMKDSERAADLARQNGLPVGLHLNFIEDFTDNMVPGNLGDKQRLVAAYLKAWKFSQVLFNPFIHNAFDYVFQAQWDEFYRLYGEQPTRLDGHHHMHLCMNMLASGRLPKGLRVRRNFTFEPGEKNPLNRFYRYLVDRWLNSRFLRTDFFSIVPIDQERLQRLILMSKSSDVELMVHPGIKKEYLYLLSLEWESLISGL